MKIITATNAKNNFGDVLLNVQSTPISITRNGKVQSVMLSSQEYIRLKNQALQNAITEGLDSGDCGALDMQSIKNEASARIKD
jgi:prevent-host-death family protein